MNKKAIAERFSSDGKRYGKLEVEFFKEKGFVVYRSFLVPNSLKNKKYFKEHREFYNKLYVNQNSIVLSDEIPFLLELFSRKDFSDEVKRFSTNNFFYKIVMEIYFKNNI